jgi:hypothetical protein
MGSCGLSTRFTKTGIGASDFGRAALKICIPSTFVIFRLLLEFDGAGALYK